MITKVTIKNFKRLENVSFTLSQLITVVVGPNNSGKSTLCQALCLWEIGVTKYIESHRKHKLNKKGNAVVNRHDLTNTPIEDARFLWKDRKVSKKNEKGLTKHIPISITLDWEQKGKKWSCKIDFEYYNTESFSCKIDNSKKMTELYESGNGIYFGFLQTMSGISTNEDKLTQGTIDRKLGEGKISEVLRNICYDVLYPNLSSQRNPEEQWKKLCKKIETTFKITLLKPQLIKATGLIDLQYEENSIRYDLSSAGSGFLQALSILAYIYANPNKVLLLDEPDAHLELIRQQEIYKLIHDIADEMNTQVIMISHSERILEESKNDSNIIALIENKAIELNNSDQKQIKAVKSALTNIPYSEYYLARSTGHILYLEGSTDFKILCEFSNKLDHKTKYLLEKANVKFIEHNRSNTAIGHFEDIQRVCHDFNLKGLAIFDNIKVPQSQTLKIICWKKKEIENYFAKPNILCAYAKSLNNKFSHITPKELANHMEESIREATVPIYLHNMDDKWWNENKQSEWLDTVFTQFYKKIKVSKNFYKGKYHQLIKYMKKEEIDKEVTEKLNEIHKIIS